MKWFLLFFCLELTPALSTDFTGTLVFTQSAVGEQAEVVEGFAPSTITITIGSSAYRQDEEGGMNEGSYIVHDSSNAALKLDHAESTTELGTATAMGDLEEVVKNFMPQNFTTKLKPTGETATIAGYTTKKYKVLESGFVNAGAEAYIWISKDLSIPRHRYNFGFEWSRVTAPIPMSIPLEDGTILKTEITENNTTVTIEAISIEAGDPDPTLFEKPSSYAGPDLP